MITQVTSPQLDLLHRGKVRDSFRVDAKTRLIVATDRLSAFDFVLDTPIPQKGEVLTRLSRFWFERTQSIVPNHFVSLVDAQGMFVLEAEPLRVEMIVRGYISGSMWRGYKEGKRTFSGITVPDGLTENARLPSPIVTPTTKEDSDREITPAEIVKSGLASESVYKQMHDAALGLFELGSKVLAEKGLLLCDTKYEFGLGDGKLILIDEIHTPDSSRFWDKAAYDRDPVKVPSYDKEFVRKWLLAQKVEKGAYPRKLEPEIVRQTTERYIELFSRITGEGLPAERNSAQRLAHNLTQAGLMRDAYVAIIMGSRGDVEWAEKIRAELLKYNVCVEMRVLSAHKNGERILEAAAIYNSSIEPGAVIAVAGESNGLGGALAANLNIPVINCPPFKNESDFLVNVQSSLRMPSRVPAVTAIRPDCAALAALRALNLPRLRGTFSHEIADMKATLERDDNELRATTR